MYCYRCGAKLPFNATSCPECDAPQKKRQRYRRRMILGLFIFLAGALCGSIIDSLFFEGKIWRHSLFGILNDEGTNAFVSNSPDNGNKTADTSNIALSDAAKPTAEQATGKTEVNFAASQSDIAPATQQPTANEADAQAVIEAPSAGSLNNLSSADNALGLQKSQDANAVIASEAVKIVETTALKAADEILKPQESELDAADALNEGYTEIKTDKANKQIEADKAEKAENSAKTLVFAGLDVLETSAKYSSYHGFLSDDKTELVFASNRQKVNGKPTYQCFIKKPSEKAKAVLAFSWAGNVWTPELTPDKEKIIFSSDSQKPEHIFAYNRKTKKSAMLTKGSTKNMMPTVSPNGKLIAFVSKLPNGANHIWLSNIDGKNLMQITSGSYDDREPRFSFDGKSLVFTRIFSYLKKSDIMRVNLEPLSEPETIISNERRNWLPAVSPDGGFLCYVRSEKTDGSENSLVLHNLTDGSESVLAPLGGKNEHFRPVWAKDSSGFVFHAGKKIRSLYFARFKQE